MGGSFAKLLKQNNVAETIYGFDPNLTNANSKQYSDAIDKVYFKEDSDVEFSLIIIATPLQFYKDSFALIDKVLLTNNPIIIDLGSLKSFIDKIVPFDLILLVVIQFADRKKVVLRILMKRFLKIKTLLFAKNQLIQKILQKN